MTLQQKLTQKLSENYSRKSLAELQFPEALESKLDFNLDFNLDINLNIRPSSSAPVAELKIPAPILVSTPIKDDYKALNINEFTRNSDNPVIVVVDSFQRTGFGTPKTDIDGDAPANNLTLNRELFHGDYIATLLTTNLPTAKLIKVTWPVDQLAEDNSEGVAIFKELKQAKQAGYHISAVNCSMTPPVPLDFDQLSKICEQTITAENIADNRTLVLLKLMNWAHTETDKNSIKQQTILALNTMTAMSELVKSGVPVYVAAGNTGPENISLYSLASGVVNVGAVDAAGVDSEYSARHSLITRKARGDFNVTVIKDGVDITGDGTADLPLSALSAKGLSGNRFVRELAGKDANAHTASASQLEKATKVILENVGQLRLERAGAVNQLLFSTGPASSLAKDPELGALLFPLSEVLKRLGHGDETIATTTNQLGTMLHPSGIYFKVDSANRVFYSPDGSNTPAIWQICGTSFASPMAKQNYLLELGKK